MNYFWAWPDESFIVVWFYEFSHCLYACYDKFSLFVGVISWMVSFLVGVMMNCLSLVSPWYNRTGWLGVKHQLTYLLSLVVIVWWIVSHYWQMWFDELCRYLHVWCDVWSRSDIHGWLSIKYWPPASVPILFYGFNCNGVGNDWKCIPNRLRQISASDLGCWPQKWHLLLAILVCGVSATEVTSTAGVWSVGHRGDTSYWLFWCVECQPQRWHQLRVCGVSATEVTSGTSVWSVCHRGDIWYQCVECLPQRWHLLPASGVLATEVTSTVGRCGDKGSDRIQVTSFSLIDSLIWWLDLV